MKSKKSIFYLLLGESIARHRKLINENQENLGEFLNLSRPTIVNIEKGRHQCNAFQLWQISQFLNTSIENLIPSSQEIAQLEEKPIIVPSRLEKDFSSSTLEELMKFINDI
jgi:DNA-binding XRE family transcriptional regulator